MHRGKAIVLICLVALCQPAFAQDELNSAIVNSRSYQLYEEKKWTELIAFGKEALQGGFDFYYLRMRLGIACFEERQFRVAAGHFQKARAFNADDEIAQEYLYNSLVLSNRFDDARKLSTSFSPALSEKLGKESWPGVDFTLIESGTKVSSRPDLFNPAFYLQAGLGHTVGNTWSLFHAFTIYNQSEHRGRIGQVQYFIQPNIPLGKNWSITPSLHWVNLTFQTNAGRSRYNDVALSASITKTTPYFELSVGGTYTNVYATTQYLQQTRLAIYPAGSPSFSLGALSYIHTEDNFVSSTVALNPFIFLAPSRHWNLYFNYLTNQNANIVELNGYLINNSPDLTLARTSGVLTVALSKHVDFYGVYQYESKQDVNSLSYSYNVFLFGLKIKP